MAGVLVTRAGLKRMQERLAHAQAAYDAVVQSNPEANEAGDSSVWHDNFAYEENQRQMHQWARRITDLRTQLTGARVVQPEPRPVRVGVGCLVVACDGTTGKEERWVIVGHDDSDVKARRVACNSPVGRALVGAAVGETCTIRSPAGEREIEVVSISAAGEDA